MLAGQGGSFQGSSIERVSICLPCQVIDQGVEATNDGLLLEQVTDSFHALAGKGESQRFRARRP